MDRVYDMAWILPERVQLFSGITTTLPDPIYYDVGSPITAEGEFKTSKNRLIVTYQDELQLLSLSTIFYHEVKA